MGNLKRAFAVAITMIAIGLVEKESFAAADLKVGDTIRVYDREGSTGGGVFEIKPIGASLFDPFRTFCLQRSESIDFSSKGFVVEGVRTHTVGGYDELDPRTAWLYTEYRKGTDGALDDLPGIYDYAFIGAGPEGTEYSANSLQRAIWYLEDEMSFSSLNTLAKKFVAAANTAVKNGWSGLGQVRVANLVYGSKRNGHKEGDRAQDVLILIPEPASIVFWMTSTAVMGLVVTARRRKLMALAS